MLPRVAPAAGQRPRAHPRPQLQVGAGVADQRGPAAGAAGPVHGDQVFRGTASMPNG